jgi:hypothetical protein
MTTALKKSFDVKDPRITTRVTEDIQAAKANDKLKTVFQAHKEHF